MKRKAIIINQLALRAFNMTSFKCQYCTHSVIKTDSHLNDNTKSSTKIQEAQLETSSKFAHSAPHAVKSLPKQKINKFQILCVCCRSPWTYGNKMGFTCNKSEYYQLTPITTCILVYIYYIQQAKLKILNQFFFIPSSKYKKPCCCTAFF